VAQDVVKKDGERDEEEEEEVYVVFVIH